MANYELIGLNEAGPDLRAPTAADTGVVVGALTVGGGLAVTGTLTTTANITSGSGILFNGDTAAANALDNYEEGTFTPAATFATPGDSSTSNQIGKYTIIGNTCHVAGRISINKGTTGAGVLTLSGLPVTSVNLTNYQCAGALSTDNLGSTTKTFQVLLSFNSTAPVFLIVTDSTGSTNQVVAADLPSGVFSVRYQFSYQIS
jgi:hypothetical protein